MRSKTSTWFETTISYQKTMEDGSEKAVNETYAVDVLSFTEAEEITIEEIAHFISGDAIVKSIKKANYAEVFFTDNANDDKWYKAKVAFVTLDEKSGKEKLTAVNYLVQADTFGGAVKNIDDVLSASAINYTIVSISETKIFDVKEHE